MQGLFDDPDHELTLLETGYRKPLSSLGLSDKTAVANTLKTHVLARVKPELDQFAEGLSVCGVLEAVRNHPDLMAPFFTHVPVELRAGMLVCDIVRGSRPSVINIWVPTWVAELICQ